MLCLEQTPEEDAAIVTDGSQATSSTQEVVPWVQGTCVDDSMQHVSGISACIEVQNLSAGDSARVVLDDPCVGSTAAVDSESLLAAAAAAINDEVHLDFPANLNLSDGHLQSAAAAVEVDPVCMAAALALRMQSSTCDRHSAVAAVMRQQLLAQTTSSQPLQADIDRPEDELAALEALGCFCVQKLLHDTNRK